MSALELATFDREYEALREGRTIIHLDGWSSISITGTDRQAFLNNFCTNDVKRLSLGESCEAFFTNVKGKTIGHGVIWCRERELVFFGAPFQGRVLAEHLDRYIIREDVQVRDTTTERTFLLVGSHALNAEWSLNSITWNLSGNNGSKIVEVSSASGADSSLAPDDPETAAAKSKALAAARIEAGVPLYGVDFDESNFPQEVGRDREAISFTKGCYLGQETVARIDALGHVNQRIVGVAFSGDEVPWPEMELTYNAAKVGEVTSATFSPAISRPLAFAIVRREAHSVGTQLESRIGDAEIIALPVGRPATT